MRGKLGRTAQLVVAVSATACTNGHGPETAPPLPSSLSLLTYATNLDSASLERRESILEGLVSVSADVACLQEVPEDFTPVEAGYELVLRAEPRMAVVQDPAPCTDADADLLLACAQQKCTEPPTAECQNLCGTELAQVATSCARCASMGGRSFQAIHDDCLKAPEPKELVVNGPALRHGLFSKHPLSSAEVVEFDFDAEVNAALHATVDLAGGRVDVWCLSVAGGDAASDALVLEAIADAASPEEPLFVLGDFGAGPASDTLEGPSPERYETYVGAGMKSLLQEVAPTCTVCDDNNGIVLSEYASGDVAVDHVWSSGRLVPTEVSRVLDEPVTLELDSFWNRRSLHYGVLAQLNP